MSSEPHSRLVKNVIKPRGPLMRLFFIIAGGVVCFGIALLLYSTNTNASAVYHATQIPDGWISYVSEEDGFELSIPADWVIHRSLGLVSFTGSNDIGVSVRRIGLPVDAFWEETRHGRYLPREVSRQNAIVAGLNGEQANYLVGNFEGSWPVESFVFSRGSATYLLSWSVGRARPDETVTDRATCRGVLTTFHFIEVRHADSFHYRDAAGRFAFEVPREWQISSGLKTEPAVSIRDGSDAWIGVYVYSQTSIEQFSQRHSIAQLPPKSEWFAHQLSGWSVNWNGHEAYVFDQGADLVVIMIFRTTLPVESMMRFLDSFSVTAATTSLKN